MHLSLGGKLRTRAEAVDNFLLFDAPERTDAFGLLRAMLHAKGGWQTGTLAEQAISAWFLATDLSRSFASVALKPVATIGLDYASGDADPADGKTGTFHNLYPLGHAYAGFTGSARSARSWI